MRKKRKAIYIYLWDLIDEGEDYVLDNMDNWGVNSLILASAYHAGKFTLPHNPKRRVIFPQDGALYFPVSAYNGVPAPFTAEIADAELYTRIIRKCEERGIEFQAWMVFMHNSFIGWKYPFLTVENVFGDHYPYALCPSKPETADYAIGIIDSLLRNYPVKNIFLESLSFMGFSHGFHHEMTGEDLTQKQKSLLSLCFCKDCLKAAEKNGVDIVNLKRLVRNGIDSPVSEVGHPDIQEKDSDILKFIQTRCETVEHLILKAVSVAATSGSGADLFGPVFEDNFERARWEGLEIKRLVNNLRYYVLPLPHASLNCAGQEIEDAVRSVSPDKIVLSVPLRSASVPDQMNFMAKAELVDKLGLAGCNFYNYGTVPLDKLEWIKNI